MNLPYSIEERIKIIQLHAEFKNCEEVRRQWKFFFPSQQPTAKSIRSLVKKFEETGSVHDRDRSGRPHSVVTEKTVETVREMLVDSPNTSIRAGALELGISNTSFYNAARELSFSPYRPTTVVALSDDDFDRRAEFCTTFLAKLDQEPDLLDKVIWSDESEFKLNGVINRHNCCYWASSNPHIQIPIKQFASGIMVWCGITSAGIIGPYFFNETVVADNYLATLNDYLWPQIKRKRMYFQQDGAGAHYAVQVRNWLDEKLPGRWIGRRGPIEWPARSPDLSPCDFFLWGYLKDIVYRERPATIEQLRGRISQACAEVPNEICANVCKSVAQRFVSCRNEGGKQQR
jgi:hypothetical protein